MTTDCNQTTVTMAPKATNDKQVSETIVTEKMTKSCITKSSEGVTRGKEKERKTSTIEKVVNGMPTSVVPSPDIVRSSRVALEHSISMPEERTTWEALDELIEETKASNEKALKNTVMHETNMENSDLLHKTTFITHVADAKNDPLVIEKLYNTAPVNGHTTEKKFESISFRKNKSCGSINGNGEIHKYYSGNRADKLSDYDDTWINKPLTKIGSGSQSAFQPMGSKSPLTTVEHTITQERRVTPEGSLDRLRKFDDLEAELKRMGNLTLDRQTSKSPGQQYTFEMSKPPQRQSVSPPKHRPPAPPGPHVRKSPHVVRRARHLSSPAGMDRIKARHSLLEEKVTHNKPVKPIPQRLSLQTANLNQSTSSLNKYHTRPASFSSPQSPISPFNAQHKTELKTQVSTNYDSCNGYDNPQDLIAYNNERGFNFNSLDSKGSYADAVVKRNQRNTELQKRSSRSLQNQNFRNSGISQISNSGISQISKLTDKSLDYAFKPIPMSQSFEENFFAMQHFESSHGTRLAQFPVANHSHMSLGSDPASYSDGSTVEDLISDISPELTIRPIKPLTVSNLQRMSEYDNVSGLLAGVPSKRTASSVGTNYCKPWDSTLWDDLMNLGNTAHRPNFDIPPAVARLVRGRPSHSESDYTSVYGASTKGSGAIVPSETGLVMADWHQHNDDDSATDTLPRSVNSLRSDGEGSVYDSATKMAMERPELAGQSYISDDEGVEDDQELQMLESARDNHKLMPLLVPPKFPSLKSGGSRHVGMKVRDYIYNLAQDSDTTFGATVQNFLQCTIEGTEADPIVVMRNVRQFMNGIKNYLVTHGETKLNTYIEKERKQLEPTEFLNIDAVIEGALHKCVVKPLKQHVYKLFVNEYKKNGNLYTVSDNIKYARTKTPQEMGIKPGLIPPDSSVLELTRHFLAKMQKSYSPLKKLENLLGAMATVYNNVQFSAAEDQGMQCLGADDLLPLIMYVVVHCGLVSAEIEADYMWGLLHPCVLAGDGGYHLTTFSSAILILKNLQNYHQTSLTQTQVAVVPPVGDHQGFMKILIPDETHDNLATKTLPIRPIMTAKDVCNMIAHRFSVTNPQDYGLYILDAGKEEKLEETDCPQALMSKRHQDGSQSVFAYKRTNAKFVWPVNIQ